MARAAENPVLALAGLRSPRGAGRAWFLMGVSAAGTLVALVLLISGHPGLALRAYCGTVLLVLAVVLRWSLQGPGLRAAR